VANLFARRAVSDRRRGDTPPVFLWPWMAGMPEMQEQFPAMPWMAGMPASLGHPWPSRHLGSCPAEMPKMQEQFSAGAARHLLPEGEGKN